MFDLVVQTGKMEGKRLLLPLEKDIVIGREEGCQIVLHSTLISRQHCRLRRTELGVQVTDLGSQNGTFVNDVAIDSETLLVNGDTLRIGAIVFEVQPHHVLEDAARTAAAASAVGIAAPQTKRKPADPEKSSGISDHDIAAWLSDHETATVTSLSDTTVIRAQRAEPPPPAPPTAVPASKAAAPTPPKPSRPRSVKEEAADIIRRHWAKVRGDQADAS